MSTLQIVIGASVPCDSIIKQYELKHQFSAVGNCRVFQYNKRQITTYIQRSDSYTPLLLFRRLTIAIPHPVDKVGKFEIKPFVGSLEFLNERGACTHCMTSSIVLQAQRTNTYTKYPRRKREESVAERDRTHDSNAQRFAANTRSRIPESVPDARTLRDVSK